MLFLLVITALILLNAYFSAAEIAIVSLEKFRVQELADQGDNRAKILLGFLQDPDEYLSAIQVGITLIGIVEGLYGGEIAAAYLEPVFRKWGLSSSLAHITAIIGGVGVITYATILIGELFPKTIALMKPEKISLSIAPSFRLFTLVFYPFVRLLTLSTHLLLRIFKITKQANEKLTDGDLKNLLSQAYKQGTIEKAELVLHENIFNFYERTIDKIMTPPDKVISVDESMPSETIHHILKTSGHSYFPVLRNKTKVAGYLSARDFFMSPEKSASQLMKQACMIRGNKMASDLLEKFKAKHQNFGIVSDESGELMGVVTMHDIGRILVGTN